MADLSTVMATMPAANANESVKTSVPRGRFEKLDALRGVASFWVVLHHSFGASIYAMSLTSVMHLTPLRLIFNARPPVIFFFVLSGFVLAVSYGRETRPQYGSFVARRFFRIYIPFASVVLLSAIVGLAVAHGPNDNVTSLVNDMWDHISLNLLFSHLIMTGVIGQTTLDAPMWSLVQEMRVSLVFPALFAATQVMGAVWAGIGAVFVFLAAWAALHHLGQDSIGYYAAVSPVASLFLTLFVILPFVVGIGIAIERERLVRWTSRLPWPAFALVAIGVAAVALSPAFSPGMDAVYTLAAGSLIILTLSRPSFFSLLGTRPLQFLGRISYSLYLVHLPVLGAMVCLMANFVPVIWIVCISPFVSILVAAAVYSTVEVFSIDLGRKFAISGDGRFSRRSRGVAADPHPVGADDAST